MKKVRAPKVRNSLATIIGKLPSEGLTTEKIIASLRKHNGQDIIAETPDLVEIALIRLVSQVGALRTASTKNFQAELFEEYAVSRRIYLTVDTKKGPERVLKNTVDLTTAETERYVAEHERPRAKVSDNVNELKRWLADTKVFNPKPNDKLFTVWRAARGGASPP